MSHFGAVSGMSFCQNPGAPAPLGNRWRLSGRSWRWRQHRRRDPREVADQLALGDGRRVGALGAGSGSNSGLSRFVSLSSSLPDLPDALLAERVERLELVLGDAPRSAGISAGAARRPSPALGAPRLRCGARRRLRWLLRHRWCLRFGGLDRGWWWRPAFSRATVERVAARLDALERRLADHAVTRPAAQLRPDHELRPDPGDVAQVAAPAAAVVLRRRRGRTAARPRSAA